MLLKILIFLKGASNPDGLYNYVRVGLFCEYLFRMFVLQEPTLLEGSWTVPWTSFLNGSSFPSVVGLL